MKRILLFLVLILVVGFGFLQLLKKKVGSDLRQPVAETVLSPSPTLIIDTQRDDETFLFVPYWALKEDSVLENKYNTYLYFGITPDKNGIATEEGRERLELFNNAVPEGKKKLLVVRMIDPDNNTEVLKSTNLREKIIQQTIAEAKRNDFQGVVLDLEMSAIPFASVIEQINSFNKTFATEVKKAGLEYAITMYGDVFYRVRPFDLKVLAKDADSVFIMAYDFHKSRGNPGPNFPLGGEKSYGYDMEELMNDFLRVVPSRNIIVIFGMFGYDWEIDESGKSSAGGKALTLKEIEKKFLPECPLTDCKIKRDEDSGENNIVYKDPSGQKHSVWYEDTISAERKQRYLRTMGIERYAYWAYSYY